MTPVTVEFTPDAAELARAQAQFAGPDVNAARTSVRWGLWYAAAFGIQGALDIGRHHNHSEIFGWVGIVLAIFYGFAILRSRLPSVLLAEAGRAVELCIDDNGLTLSQPPTRIPWKRVLMIWDVGEAFVAVRASGKSILILKRALPGGGSALWNELDAKLTSFRYLIRGTRSRPLITNASAR